MTAPPFHRKIGGIHWFALGRVRIGVCWVKYPGISRKMAQAFSTADARFRADQRPKAAPKRGSALSAGEARTRAREPTDMPEGEYTGMSVANWRMVNRSGRECKPIPASPAPQYSPGHRRASYDP